MLIILLTLVAVSIVAGIVVPFVNKSLKSTSCFKAKDYLSFDDRSKYNCYDESNARYIIAVKSKLNETTKEGIKGFNLRFIKEDNVKVIGIIEGSIDPNLKMFDQSISANLILPSAGKYPSLVYNYTSSETYEKVELYALMNDDRVCDKSDSIKLPKCV